MTLLGKVLKVMSLLLGGILLNIVLLALGEAVLERKVELRQRIIEAQRSPVAVDAMWEAFRRKDAWAEYALVPLIGCLIGAYAGLFQRRRPALLAVACLLPEFLYEIVSQPVRTWSPVMDVRYFGMRLVGFLLAMGMASSLRRLWGKRVAASRSL